MAIFESGNAVIAQSGGPTAAINATLAGVIKGCLDTPAIEKTYGVRFGMEGLLTGDFIDMDDYGFTKEDFDLLSATPGAALGSCRTRIEDDETITKVLEVLAKHNVRYVFYIGGNDSMDAIAKMSAYVEAHEDAWQANFIGVPKTIDNDLYLTDHTPGYGSAAKYVAVCTQEIIRDIASYTTKAVTIIEVMGRDAGWLTAATAISGHLCGAGPDLIYLPEVTFDDEKFISDVKAAFEDDSKPYVVIAVSEGVKNADKEYVAKAEMSGATDNYGHKYLAGVGKHLENLIRREIGCKVRSVEISLLQRCASHIASACDIEESQRIGEAAVRHGVVGETGKMMTFRRVKNADKYTVEVFSEDLSEIANRTRKVPAAFIGEDGTSITEKCLDYMLPLIQGEAKSVYEDGVPVHFAF